MSAKKFGTWLVCAKQESCQCVCACVCELSCATLVELQTAADNLCCLDSEFANIIHYPTSAIITHTINEKKIIHHCQIEGDIVYIKEEEAEEEEK